MPNCLSMAEREENRITNKQGNIKKIFTRTDRNLKKCLLKNRIIFVQLLIKI